MWYRMIGMPDIPLNNPGKFSITYLDSAGHRLAHTGFDFNFIPPNPKVPFSPLLSLRIPDVEGTHRIVISNGPKVLLEQTISSHAPTVKIR